MTSTTQKSPGEIAQILEGVDFIETEEDAKAVEAATLKIQSTFRGKKIRSKLGGGSAAAGATDEKKEAAEAPKAKAKENPKADPASSGGSSSSSSSAHKTKAANELAARELCDKVAEMQVKDNKEQQAVGGGGGQAAAPPVASSPPEEEAERAATKIQAGFKGYKTRKELEGKLPANSAGAPAGGGGADDATPAESGATR